MRPSPLVLAVAALLLTGCPLLDVEVDVPEVCVTYADLPVEAADRDGAVTIHRSFAVDDLSLVHRLTDLDAELAFVGAALIARTGIAGFAFVDAARISISSGGSELPPLVLYQCAGDCVPADGALDMTAASEHDALAYLRGDGLIIDLELTGRLPTVAWTMTVDVCFAGRAGYTY